MSTKRSERRAALALTAAAMGALAPLAYLAQRLYERARTGPIDPTLILRESHTAFYWRAGAAAWWAGVAAIAIYAWSVRREAPERASRLLRLAVAPLVLAIALLAWRYA